MSEKTNVIDQMSLRGKVALLTGATGYLGKSMAMALAEAGATVVVSSRRIDDAKQAALRLPHADTPHQAVALDHMDEASIRAGFESAIELAGRVDIVVNNGHEGLADDWRTVTAAQFSRQIANATGYFLLSRMLRDHVVARQGAGSVILIGSMYGSVGSYPEVYEGVCNASPVAYHALKGGIVHMTRHLAVYWAKDNVRVNCLSPGPFPGKHISSELLQRLVQKSPMGRMGVPDELKGPLVFLASDASSYMTGQNLIIDGGWTAW